jgi:hypothetical protein
VQTGEDLTESVRRRVYVEATLLPTVLVAAAVPVGSVALLGLAPFTAAYAIFASVHAGVLAAIGGRLGSRVTADRATHLAALRSAWALHAPLLVGVAALEYLETRRWAFMAGVPRQGALALPDLIGVGAPLLALAGVVLHRAAAGRAFRLAGVTEMARERRGPLRGRGWMEPPLVVAALIAIGYVFNVATR